MAFNRVNFERILQPENFIGRSPKQVDEFLAEVVAPICRKYKSQIDQKAELNV